MWVKSRFVQYHISIAIAPTNYAVNNARSWNKKNFKNNARAAWRKIKWRDLLPCAGYFCIFPKFQLFFFKKCNLITFSPRCVKTKFHHYSFINNYFEIEIHNSQWDPRDKPGFNSLPKPTFKLCFLCGVVKTCLPWNFIAFLNLKCWWEWEKGNIGIFQETNVIY